VRNYQNAMADGFSAGGIGKRRRENFFVGV
jgi:hypothetical protein